MYINSNKLLANVETKLISVIIYLQNFQDLTPERKEEIFSQAKPYLTRQLGAMQIYRTDMESILADLQLQIKSIDWLIGRDNYEFLNNVKSCMTQVDETLSRQYLQPYRQHRSAELVEGNSQRLCEI